MGKATTELRLRVHVDWIRRWRRVRIARQKSIWSKRRACSLLFVWGARPGRFGVFPYPQKMRARNNRIHPEAVPARYDRMRSEESVGRMLFGLILQVYWAMKRSLTESRDSWRNNDMGAARN